MNWRITVLQTVALPLGYGAMPFMIVYAGTFVPMIFENGKQVSVFRFLVGAGYEIRTRDFHLGKVTLYH